MSFLHSVRSLKLTAGLLSLLIVTMALGGCGRSNAKSEEAATPPPETGPVAVTTARASAREMASYLQATGSFAADEASDIAPETSGQVVATPVDVGDFVKQGAVVARLDDRDARLRLQQALANEKQAEAAVRQAEERLGLRGKGSFDATAIPEVRAAYQQYEAAEAQAKLADTNARRYANLVETGDVSRIVYDQARTQAETARAQANAARQQYELAVNMARQSNQAIFAAQAQLDGARAQVGLARKALSDTVVTAPFAGYISDRPVAVGEYVTPASKIATVLFTNPIKLRLQLPEVDAGRVSAGMAVSSTVAAFPDREFDGQVTAVNPEVDLTSRTITVEVSIKNPGNVLRSGMFATARIAQPGGVQAVFVPRGAVITDPTTNSSSVYVIEGDTARLRVVQKGEQEGEMVRVASGVAAGEVVATDNVDKLFDGATVEPR